MPRRCSYCNSSGHNSRSCTARTGGGGGLRLFGVRLTDGSFIKKSASMGNISHYPGTADSPEGYHSDDLDHGFAPCRRPLRKKGVPWTEEEHRQFLLGLQHLGKGDWRGISRNYVPSRTPTQVASHAQKYFIRQSNANRKKKKASLFDIVPDKETNSSTPEQFSFPSPVLGTNNENLMLSSSQEEDMINSPSLDLSLKPAFMPFPFQLWPPNAYSPKDDGAGTSHNRMIGPESVVPEGQELVSMSQLTLGDTSIVQFESLPLSLKLPGNP
ncbi:UNVERIFIED_CONTAM: Transcription factor KUA1 [Sesamum calycinum]|uniref:Transcription factor KUA1 n=2 Tax=Sesamum TaxID=4181 RepID=A0AAW2ND66_9LAMI